MPKLPSALTASRPRPGGPSYVEALREDPWYTPIVGVARGFFAYQGLQLDVRGEENVPTTGAGIVAMNHISYLDFALAGVPFRVHKRLVRFMCKASIFEHPVAGPLMRGMKHIPVDRAAGAASYRAAVDALRAGQLVGVFPEATISMSFEPKDFKNGAARMAAETGAPIIPVAMWGAQRIWTKGRPKRIAKPTRVPVRIAVGEPIHVAPDADVAQVTADLHATITAMVHELQVGYPRLFGDEMVFVPNRLGGHAPTLEEAAAINGDPKHRR